MNLRHLLTTILLVVLITNVNAVKIIYEDNTHLHNLICCNSTECITLRDISYEDNNTYVEFNRIEITNIITCYEAGNRFDSNISDIALSYPKSIVIIIFVFLLFVGAVFLFSRAIRGKK